ncbi:hypothetical protein OUZ56_029553 [Daphnia magna]|uniref:Uncharacterized protein n=1 Tax=Daphnia magna TaxID=35525 RepID=A0ABR0B762_9CRUS|nr:hypothetical protein OUZ56_029553 [Daphnia magna]
MEQEQSEDIKNKHNEKLATTQCTLTQVAQLVVPYKFNQLKSDEYFLQFFNSHSFSLGEEVAFQRFISSLQPLYRPLGRTAVKDKLMTTFIAARDKVIRKQSSPDYGPVDLAK